MDFYLRRNDTLPIIEYTCKNEAGNAVDVHDASVKFNMGWAFVLPSEINSVSQASFIFPEQVPNLLINDVLVIDQERMVIEDIDRIANSIAVTRGVDTTSPAKHPVDSVVKVIRIESAASLKNDGLNGIVKYEWSASNRDTKMPGRYFAEFEVTFLTNGKRQTFPAPMQEQLRVIIKDDINAR